MISNAIEDKPLPIYGDGMQVRDWLYVDDHCRAILAVIERGRAGEIYNIGGSRALPNLEVVERILDTVGKPRSLMQTVKDRPGHDRRYALTTEKLMRETGWQAEMPFEAGLRATIDWYLGERGLDRPREVRRVSKLLSTQLREPRGVACSRRHFAMASSCDCSKNATRTR